jgi:amino-acid N-acetyltransferase
MRIQPSPPEDRALALLSSCHLPVDDLVPGHPVRFLGCGSPQDPGGVIGLEVHGEHGLLRSLAVDPDQRGRGCGAALVAAVEAEAVAAGVRTLWLLTGTAVDFFAGCGYRPVARDGVPDMIRKTRQFAAICPSSATVMTKALYAPQ